MKKVLSMALLVAAMVGTSVGASAQELRHHRRMPQKVTIRREVHNPRFMNKCDARQNVLFVRCDRCGKVILLEAQDFRPKDARRPDFRKDKKRHSHRHSRHVHRR